MSPRRMDISSLLRDPSPPRQPDRPRTIDALLHHTPPRDHRPPRAPFLGLDALVHAASEEHRRITAASSLPDTLSTHLDRDRPPVHDHDRLPRHYPHRQPDLPSPFQDPGLHKSARNVPGSLPLPHSPSPELKFPPVLTSPSTRHHPSASPTNNYPTLRRQPMEPPRSAPALLAGPVNDTRTVPHSPSISLQHTPPFLHPLHPVQLPIHSSPRNSSPHRHSPLHPRSQHHSSPTQVDSFIPAPIDADAMPARYSHGPKMAGGIEVLSNEPSSIRILSRPDLSNYRGPGRDISAERFVPGSRVDPARHEPSQLSPLPAHAFSPDGGRHQVTTFSDQAGVQESALLRERVRSCPPHSPRVAATTGDCQNMGIPMEGDLLPPLLAERHPIRVWEEQPRPRDSSRLVSPVHFTEVVCPPAVEHSWPKVGESAYGEQPVKKDHEAGLRQDIADDVLTYPLSTRQEPPPPRVSAVESSASDLRTPNERIPFDSQPLLPTSVQPEPLIQSEAQAHLPRTSLLNSIPCAPASPVLELHLKNFESQPEFHPEHPDIRTDASTGVPPTFSGPTIAESPSGQAELMPEVMDTVDTVTTNPLPRWPSPEPTQPMLTKELERQGTPAHTAYADALQNTSRSPSQHSLSVLSPVKNKHNAPPDDVLVTSPIQPELPRRSPELDYTSEQELPVSEPSMMDVDEELLSLVEDRPARPAYAITKSQTILPPPATKVRGNSAGSALSLNEAFDGLPLVSSSQSTPKGPPFATNEKDRASMPPPAVRNKKTEKEKTSLAASIATGSKKRKDGSSKPAAKSKQPSKPRAKPAPKLKVKPSAVDTSLKGSIAKNVNARSRSTSVVPDAVPEPEVDESGNEDEKLYCVCKTRYDEDRTMIACDRCDEWFHTLCVDVPDLEIDLVDQFTCPLCIQKHPYLKTTWKRRCLFGLQHENPSSPEACHKPSRGAFSKYCSDDCGINYMRTRITQWEKSGGSRGLLWESAKNATKREGVVVYAETSGTSPPTIMGVEGNNMQHRPLGSSTKRRAEREVARLNARLEEVVNEREFMKRELDMVMWREKVVELASERAGTVDECGWDQRLCFGEEEWADFGPEVLESYEEERVKVESGDDAMSLDAVSIIHGEWWCTGKKKCERHAGWQKLRAAEVSFDKETKEGVLLKLTTREREIRKCIEDILYPQPAGTLQAPPHPEVQLNGTEKSRLSGHISARGKKRPS